MSITWSPLAIERISEIAAYIAQENPQTAENWVEKIFDLIERLAEFPESGGIVPEINNPASREVISGNYRVIYDIEDEGARILTVRHGKQILPIDDLDH